MLPVLHMLNSGHTSQKCNIHVTCYDKMCSFVDKHWIVSSGKVLTGLWVVLSAQCASVDARLPCHEVSLWARALSKINKNILFMF